MTGVSAQHVKWYEDFFEKVFSESWQCISAVTGQSEVIGPVRAIAESLLANEQGALSLPKKSNLRYCDDMEGDTLALLYRHLLELDTYYS
jgi:hypothetical protein